LRRALLLTLTLLPLSSHAITLRQAEELAVKNYPKIKKFELLKESSLLRAESAKRERFGTLNLISSYTSFNKNFTFVPLYYMPSPKNPPPFNSRKLVYGVSFSVPLYLGGAISKTVEIEKLKSSLFESLKNLTSWQVKFNVDSVYLSYLKLNEVKGALLQYKKSLEKLKSDVAFGVKVGKFAKVDLLKVEYSLKEVEAKIKEVEEKQKNLKIVLETLIGKEVKTLEPYRVNYSPKSYSLLTLYREAIKRNSLIKAKRENVKVAQKLKELIRAKYNPKLFVDGTYTRNYGFDTNDNVGVGSVSVKVAYPVFEWNRKKLELLSKELEKLSKERELKEAKLQLKRELSEAVSKLNAVQADIEAYKKKLSYAEEVERIERLKYKSGKGDMDHLLLAEANLYMTEAQLSGAYYDWEIEIRRIAALLEVEDEGL